MIIWEKCRKLIIKRKIAPGAQQSVVEKCLDEAWIEFCWELENGLSGQKS